jgi:hypothetical protein
MLSRIRKAIFQSSFTPVYFILTVGLVCSAFLAIPVSKSKASSVGVPDMTTVRVLSEHRPSGETYQSAEFCVDHVEYLMIGGALTVKYLPDGHIATC